MGSSSALLPSLAVALALLCDGATALSMHRQAPVRGTPQRCPAGAEHIIVNKEEPLTTTACCKFSDGEMRLCPPVAKGGQLCGPPGGAPGVMCTPTIDSCEHATTDCKSRPPPEPEQPGLPPPRPLDPLPPLPVDLHGWKAAPLPKAP